MKKNEIYEVEILDNGMEFEGISRINDIVVFVPGAIKGEVVNVKIIKVNKSYCIGKIESFVKKSKFRCEAFCDVYKRCGGCSAQHIEYNMQLELKHNMVKNVLEKQNIVYKKLNQTIGMGLPYYYRNKVQYPVRTDKDGNTKIGFYSKMSHDIISNNCCYIQNRVIDILAKNVFDELVNGGFNGYDEKNGNGDIRHILIRRGHHTRDIMIVIVVNNKELLDNDKLKKVLKNIFSKNYNLKSIYLNLNSSNTNEILGNESKLIIGDSYITDYIGDYEYYIGPKSFFQVNTLQAEVLYNKLKEGLKLNKGDVLFDLYSGVGTIGIFLSDMVEKVYGIEIEPNAIDMANINLDINGVKNAEYISGSVEDKIKEFAIRNIQPSVIVVDPPRKGLDEKSIEYILNFKPSKIGYISCNPSTFARDLKLFQEKYDVQDITPIDMFPNTSHVECCALLCLK